MRKVKVYFNDFIFSEQIIMVLAFLIALLGIVTSVGSIMFYSTPEL